LLKRFDPVKDPGLDALLPKARNLVSAPLIADGEVLGLLVAEYTARFGGRVERRVLAMVNQFVAHAALALRNAWLREEIQRLAETDALTGLANRRIFQATLDRELSRASRSGDPVTLILVDLDFFKDLNDTRGHQVGDQMLQVIADVLRTGCRDFDTAARYGGEEFAVILPGCSASEAQAAGDRFRLAVAAVREPAPVTASLGAATYPVTAVTGDDLLRAADDALYESKRGGRNRVTVSDRTAKIAPAAS
ncbi:MAG: GGDEF domain-containing protein, partial [Actinomycetota bacterium]